MTALPGTTRRPQNIIPMPRGTTRRLPNITEAAITKKRHITRTQQVDTPVMRDTMLRKQAKLTSKNMDTNNFDRYVVHTRG